LALVDSLNTPVFQSWILTDLSRPLHAWPPAFFIRLENPNAWLCLETHPVSSSRKTVFRKTVNNSGLLPFFRSLWDLRPFGLDLIGSDHSGMVTLSHHDRMLRARALLHRCASSFQTFCPFGLESFRLCHPVITPGHATTPIYLARPFLIDRYPFGWALTPFDAKASLDSPRSLAFFPSKDNVVHGSVQTATCNGFYPGAFVWSAQPFWTAWQRFAFARLTSLFRYRTTLTLRFG